jgi:bacteriorhodopsin
MSAVILSGKVSLGIQALVGALDVYALSLPRSRSVLLRDLLQIELGVQTIEFVFYAWMVRSWGEHSLERIVRFRYLDWMFSTPFMLITLMAFLGGAEDESLGTFVARHSDFITSVVSLNALMLVIGLGGELQCLPQTQSVVLGFLPFFTYFAMIYRRFIHEKNVAQTRVQLFYYFFAIWATYGMVALAPPEPKNLGYNILDLFSKNLLGVILSVMLFLRPAS